VPKAYPVVNVLAPKSLKGKGPDVPILNPSLYAIVSPAKQQAAPPKKIHKVAARAERSSEFVLKAQIDRLVVVLDRHEARVATYKKQAAALNKRTKVTEDRQQRIEKRALDLMAKANVVIAPGFKRELKANLCPQSVEVIKESDIPKEFLRDKTTSAPDKVFISRTLTLGFIVTDVNQLPPEFLTDIGGVNEGAIKAALSAAADVAGVQPVYEIPGVRLVQRTTLLRV
jgi:hypothetical protein